MLDSEECRELRNDKRYYTSIERTRSDHGSIEGNVTGISSEYVEGEIRRFIASLIRQLDELTRLVQVMVTTQHLDHYPRTKFGTTAGTATYQCDNH